MGCFDIICFCCGLPPHSFFESIIENIQESYLIRQQRKKIDPWYEPILKKMDEDPEYLSKMKKHIKETLWLNHCTFLTKDNQIIHDCHESSCNIDFKDKKGDKYYQDVFMGDSYTDLTEKTHGGIFLHSDCWKFIQKKMKIDLLYSDVPVIIKPREFYKINPTIDYKEIKKYWSQDFRFELMFVNSNQYMCESPLKNTKNANRIQKIISQFKFNTDKNRKGPAVSATFYPENTIKYGINHSLWIKSGGKWKPIDEPVERKKIEVHLNNHESNIKKHLKKIVCIGEQTSKPIMIVSMKEKKKGIYEIELIGTPKELKKING